MNLKTAFLLFSLSLAPTLGCGNSPAEQVGIHHGNPDALRILPLGDSITQADAEHMSYRFWLWELLAEKQIAIDFVGAQNTNFKGNPDFPTDFDRNHEGHWGLRTDEVLSKLPSRLEHYSADVALIHLGTNDCLSNEPIDQIVDELKQVVEVLRTDNPEIDIVFSPLGQTTWHAKPCLARVNRALPTLAKRLTTPKSRVVLTPTEQPVLSAEHLFDGLHPNAHGEKRLAKAWLEAILALY